MRTASGRCRSTKPWIHSAPSCTAHTSLARPTPRRSVSTVASRPKVSESLRREKYERLTASTCCPGRCLQGVSLLLTCPMTTVLASAHTPPTSGTMAPSLLRITLVSGSLTALWCGWHDLARPFLLFFSFSCTNWLACSFCTASYAAPASSVCRRAVASLTCTPIRSASSWTALAKGIHRARCTKCSSCSGVKLPGCRPNSSSKGEKACPAFGTGSVGSFQLHLSSHRGLHPSLLLASGDQGFPAVTTRGSLLGRLACPLSGPTEKRTFFDQMRFQPAHPLSCLQLDLSHRRFRVAGTPFFHPRDDFIKH